MRARRTALALLLAAGVPAAAGCAGDEGAPGANRPRPPAPVTLTAAIQEARVSLSPTRLGAGPVEVLVSNQTGAAHRVTLETGGGAAGVTRTTGAVAPRGVARLQLELPPGTYALRTQTRAIRPATLRVGASRPSSQDEVMLP